MKYLCMIPGLVFLVMSGCSEVIVDVNAEATAVSAVLDSYVNAVISEDIEMYGKNVAHDEGMVNFGGFGGPINGWTALKELMQQQNASLADTKIDVSDLKIHVSPDGRLAWATCLWTLTATTGDGSIELPLRCTWILEKREHQWVIVHFHKSTPAG